MNAKELTPLEALERFRDDIEIGYLRIDNLKDKQNYLGLLDIIETALNDEHLCKYIINKICEYLGLDMKSHRDLIETENEILNALIEYEKKSDCLDIVKEIAKSLNLTFYRNNPTISFKIKGRNEFLLQEITFKDEWKYFLLKEYLE